MSEIYVLLACHRQNNHRDMMRYTQTGGHATWHKSLTARQYHDVRCPTAQLHQAEHTCAGRDNTVRTATSRGPLRNRGPDHAGWRSCSGLAMGCAPKMRRGCASCPSPGGTDSRMGDMAYVSWMIWSPSPGTEAVRPEGAPVTMDTLRGNSGASHGFWRYAPDLEDMPGRDDVVSSMNNLPPLEA